MRDDGQSPAGGILVLAADDDAVMRRMMPADPYFQPGLWQDVRIYPFKELLNGWR
jgi:uncharacterized protein YciI